METIKLKFIGKWDNVQPEDNLIVYWLKKSGIDVQMSEEPDYVVCDVFGNPPYEYCKYPQIRIFECGENYVPDFNLMDYAVSRYPIAYGDRNFYYPGCTNPGEHWHALGKKDRQSWGMEKLQEKTCFANLITSHDSEHQLRSTMFHKLSAYKRVESAGSLLNNMPGGQKVDWLDGSKVDLQKKCKFTICFESTDHYGFITEKITDAFYADTIPIYYGSENITDIFNRDAFINVRDYPSLDAVVERVRELDQDDEQYLQMLRQPILVDPEYPEKLDRQLQEYILHIFQQPYEQAYRRSRVYYPQNHNDYLAECMEPTRGYLFKQKLKKMLKK